MSKKIKVIIADDLTSVRDGLRAFLLQEGIEVIGEAINGKQLLKFIETDGLLPDVILLDIDMPEMDGIEALVNLKKFNPNIKVIMLTLYSNKDLITDIKEKGANCFFDKGTGIDVIVDAIRKLANNDRFSNIPKKMKPIFTKVEVEIIQLIKKHKTTNEIAEIRGKSVKSIEAHRKKMYEKAGVTSASEFSSFCTKEGIFFLGH
jgi:DNA-binding NarL/FixJ family response regulator